MNQIELHKKIENFFKSGIASAKADVAQRLIINDDAKNFFFSQADENWIDWLWQNKFLENIKENKGDTTLYSYRMPELEFLTRVTEKDPSKVAQIINSVSISEENFNPEVIDRFLWIISSMPAEQIKKLTKKIRDEQWVYLMRKFSKSGYEFDKIVKKLVAEKEYNAILEITEGILIISTEDEIAKKTKGFGTDDPFYLHDVSASGIFEALLEVNNEYTEKALSIMAGIMASIVKLAKADETKIFDYQDSFYLYDVDFFTLELKEQRHLSYREDVKSIAATLKKLFEINIENKCGDSNEAHKVFKYIDDLPKSRATWRLRLFALTRCPQIFKKELKDSFFKLFEAVNYYDIEGGTEYKKALRIGFPYLSDLEQREYVSRVFEYFKEKADKNPEEHWHKRTGWEILSSICDQLKDSEIKKCEEIFGAKCDGTYEPEPTMSMVKSGSVSHLSPVDIASFSVAVIIEKLKTEWTPEQLNEQFKNDDFLNPRGVEGLGDALKEDIKKRTDEYLSKLNNFFDRNAIAPHYLYSLLRGVEEMLRNKDNITVTQVGNLMGLFEAIRKDGAREVFKRDAGDSWMVDWITVHKVISDILLYILENKETKEEVHRIYRKDLKDVISYLLTIKDSPSKDDEKPEYGEPYHIAINSVRGRAYEAFVVFTENDGKILAEDVRNIYKQTLLDMSLAVRFVIGRYLPSFYFRDKEFIKALFPEIFPKDNTDKKDVYLATWEGYLSTTLYDQLFVELKDYYEHAISLDSEEYTKRKYLSGLDESLAVHLALAFAHLGLKIEDSLFIEFWSKPNTIRQHEFISFIGRSVISRDQASNEWLEENKVSKDKLIQFWDWTLGNQNIKDPKIFAGFGFWINPNKEILTDATLVPRIAKTLKRSNGDIDWDYGLLNRIEVFAKVNPAETLEVVKNFLLDSVGNLNQHRHLPLGYRDEIKEALKIVYSSGGEHKQKVSDLVNILIEKGSMLFWGLKEVMEGD